MYHFFYGNHKQDINDLELELNSRANQVAFLVASLLRKNNVTFEALIEAYPEAKLLKII